MSVAEFFGYLSAMVVFASYPVYIWRVWQKKITPKIASWLIFVIMSIALYLSYTASGAKENGYVTIGPLIGCTIILIVTLIRSRNKKITFLDWVCIFSGMGSIFLWAITTMDWSIVHLWRYDFFIQISPSENTKAVQYALYLAILTDLIGIIPSAVFLKKEPWEGRPGMGVIFSFGYFLAIFLYYWRL